jgi:hypothetical protein
LNFQPCFLCDAFFSYAFFLCLLVFYLDLAGRPNTLGAMKRIMPDFRSDASAVYSGLLRVLSSTGTCVPCTIYCLR